MPPSTRLYSPSSVPPMPPGLPINSAGAGLAAGALPASITVTGIVETMMPNVAIPTAPLILSVPPGSPLEAQRFEVYAAGKLNIGTSAAPTIKLYANSLGNPLSLTPGSNILLGSSGAITAFAGQADWWISALLIFDSVNGVLMGTAKFFANNVLVAEVAISNKPTGVKNVNNPVISFGLSVTFSIAGTQVFTVQDFGVNF